MSQIIIDGEADDTDQRRPPRLARLMGAAAVAVLGIFALLNGVGDEDPEAAARDIAATTTTTIPVPSTARVREEPGPAPITEVELSLSDLLAGPQFGWTDIELPDELSAVFDVGEFEGRPALVGSRNSPQEWGIPGGASLYLMDADGHWAEPADVFGEDRFYSASVIGPRGFTVTSTDRIPGWPSQPGGALVHSSVEGSFWTHTQLGEGEAVLVDSVAADGLGTWVLGWSSSVSPEVHEALVAEAGALLDNPLVYVSQYGTGVSVLFSFGLPLYETTLGDLGVQPGLPVDPSGFRRSLWVSHDRVTFTEVPDAFGEGFPGGLGGSSGIGVFAAVREDNHSAVYGSTDGLTWSPVYEADSPALWIDSAHGVDGLLLAALASGPAVPDIDVVSARSRSRFSFAFGPGVERLGAPEVGPAGYLWSTFRPDREQVAPPTEIERDGYTITFSISGSIDVYDDSGQRETFGLFGDSDDIVFDLDSLAFELVADGFLADRGTVVTTVTLDELTSAMLHLAVRPIDSPGGVLFTPDGEHWGWTPLLDVARAPSPITAAAVGERDVYVVTGSALAGPGGYVAQQPRLYVGALDG
jgi:hypothetical protein